MSAITFDGLKANGAVSKPKIKEIMTKAYGQSMIGSVVANEPVAITGLNMAWSDSDPIAGVVKPGQRKPVVDIDMESKEQAPIKVAAIAHWEEEARKADEVGFFTVLEKKMVEAIAKSIDLAVIHGKDGITGAAIPNVESIAGTTNVVELGTATTAKGGWNTDILAGYQLVTDNDGDFDTFLADKRIRTRLMSQVDVNGRPIYANGGRGGIDLKEDIGDMLGLPVHYGKAVSGKMGAVADTGIRMIGGDFKNNIQFGYVEKMNIRRSTEAVINDGGQDFYLWQENREAVLIEAIFGWLIKDVNQFVSFKVKA